MTPVERRAAGDVDDRRGVHRALAELQHVATWKRVAEGERGRQERTRGEDERSDGAPERGVGIHDSTPQRSSGEAWMRLRTDETTSTCGRSGAAPLNFRDVQPSGAAAYRGNWSVKQPLTSAVKRLSEAAGRLEWSSRASDETSLALGERSGMGMRRRGRQTTPRRTARGIDVEVAALRRQRQVSADFAGSVEGDLPRDPPGVPRLGRRQVQQSRLSLVSADFRSSA
jgi:hypothetical protein